ncbi:MAG: DUF2029 domain-containing protein [Armatimonadota bacterium]|nr:MAG: DUF2029 domain-containing protein [Armatimonadota bacterium]
MTDQRPAFGRDPWAGRIVLFTVTLLVMMLTAYMIGKFLHSDFKDAEVWYEAGRRVLDGRTLANLPHYRYPPTFAVFVAPFCAVGFAPFYFFWYVLNLWLFGLSGRAARAICFGPGREVSLHYHWLPIVLVATFAIDNLILGQTNILIMLLVYWSFLEDSRNRQWISGLPLGAAIAIKAFPAPLLAYFLYRGRLRVVVAALVSCAFFLVVVPVPARGFHRNLREVGDWGRRVVVPYLSRGQAGDWGQHSLDFGNHSLPAVARRLLTPVDAGVAAREERPLHVNVAELAESQVNWIVLGFFAALGLAFVAACGWRRPVTPTERAAEYSMATLLLLLVSALSWTYFFVILLLPVIVGLWLLADRDRLRPASAWAIRVGLWALVMATLLLWPAARPTQYVRAVGSLCWATLALFAGLVLARWDLRRSAAEVAAPEGPM